MQLKGKNVGYFYLFIGIFTWATIEITVKLIQDSTSPITINFLRMLIGGLYLLIVNIESGDLEKLKYFIQTYPKYYIPASFLGLVLGQIFFIMGTTMTNASLSATIFSSNPILISSYMMLFQGEEKSLKKVGGMLLGFFGVLMIITEFNFAGFLDADNLVGNLLVFLGMALWCIDVVVGKILLSKAAQNPDKPQFDSNDFNAVTFTLAGILMIPFLWMPGEWDILIHYSFEATAGVLYLGIVTGGIGYLFFFKGIKLMEASKGINVFYFKPIFATILAFILLGEVPSNFLYLGILIEIVSMLLISKPANKSKKQSKKELEKEPEKELEPDKTESTPLKNN